ncbi:hypothetical protein MMC22_006560 [Lobaria immixta]|nr:hypothetical protein [Lobaria immixta]
MAPVALSCDVAILLILEQNSVVNVAKLYLDPTASLKAPRLVCHLFYTLANRFFFRNFKMDGSVILNSILHQIPNDASDLGRNIWYLELWMGKSNIRLVERALDKMSKLKDLILFAAVDAVLPVPLVKILEIRSPGCRLHVANYRGRLDIEHESVQFLKTSNLYSLQTRVPSNIKERAVYLARLPSLKKVIMSASNLRLLDVDVRFGDLLHSVSAETPRVFQFEKGDQFPLLEELKLYCDSFSIENWTVWFACID